MEYIRRCLKCEKPFAQAIREQGPVHCPHCGIMLPPIVAAPAKQRAWGRHAARAFILIAILGGFFGLLVADRMNSPLDPLRSAMEREVGPGAITVFDGIDQGSLLVWWSLDDSLTAGLVRAGAEDELHGMLKALSAAGHPYEVATFVGTFPMRDSFGRTKDQPVLRATYKRSTLERIDWSGFRPSDTLNIIDDGFIHSEFR